MYNYLDDCEHNLQLFSHHCSMYIKDVSDRCFFLQIWLHFYVTFSVSGSFGQSKGNGCPLWRVVCLFITLGQVGRFVL